MVIMFSVLNSRDAILREILMKKLWRTSKMLSDYM